MGKPKGDGARTKSQPSSSSLAASLVPSGTSTVGFGGYVGSSRVESVQSPEDVRWSTGVDGEVAQHLRRLGRKDPLTKLKALSSLKALLTEKPVDEIILIIPQWAFEYKKLLYDNNREVRRATNDFMANLVMFVGRGLAPHLKSLMGPWWFSQFDPVSEISQLSRKSMQAAFPAQEKRLEALALCVNEVLTYLDENLKLTPQMISDKSAPSDELQDMHHRVVSMSLLALATLVDILVGMQYQRTDFENIPEEPKNARKAREITCSFAEKIFSAHKYFTDFLKYRSPSVRSSAYLLLRSFVKYVPGLFNEQTMKVLSPVIMGSFQEKDPSCHSSMWELLFLFTQTFPESWSIANVDKIVLPHFWHFLRNGCYGSQQVSYPTLVLFLDSIPVKAINWKKFFPNFFENLWAGRGTLLQSVANCLVFFQAIKECLLWAIKNSTRYSLALGVADFELSMTKSVILMLWHEYIEQNQDDIFVGVQGNLNVVDVPIADKRERGTKNMKYPSSYMQQLVSCIIHILMELPHNESNLLSEFCTIFLDDCLMIMKKTISSNGFCEPAERLIDFLQLFQMETRETTDKWPLVYFSGRLFAKSFPLVKISDSPAAVRVLAAIIEIFGPRKVILQYLFDDVSESGLFSDGLREGVLNSSHFLEVFKTQFVPWCLCAGCSSASQRMDLLLGLIDNETFDEQWSCVLSSVVFEEKTESSSQSLLLNDFSTLAMLAEKVRCKIVNQKAENCTSLQQKFPPGRWQHKLLNLSAVTAVRSCQSSDPYCARFLCALLGGSTMDDKINLISLESMATIFGELLSKISLVLRVSPFEWAKQASELLLQEKNKEVTCSLLPSLFGALEMAKFSLNVLETSFFSLRVLEGESELVPCLLAATFIIDWNCQMIFKTYNSGILETYEVEPDTYSLPLGEEDDSLNEASLSLNLGKSMQPFRHKIDIGFWKGLSPFTVQKLRDILIEIVRLAALSNDTHQTDDPCAIFSNWMLVIFELLGGENSEEQLMLNKLLSPAESWPLWVSPHFSDETTASVLVDRGYGNDTNVVTHQRFVSFVECLLQTFGPDRIFAGSTSKDPGDQSSLCCTRYSRPWLAAEMLCTWKWHGGSALISVLPFLSMYSERRSPVETLMNSLVYVLLDGALANGMNLQLKTLNIWVPTAPEINDIEKPFVRALVSVLVMLFISENRWGAMDAYLLFDYTYKRLYVGTSLCYSSLQVLPCILNLLVRPMRAYYNTSTEANNGTSSTSLSRNMSVVLTELMQKALSKPPLLQEDLEDVRDWVEVAISCYPLNGSGDLTCRGTGLHEQASNEDRSLLLELFRKQRLGGKILADSSSCFRKRQRPLSTSVSSSDLVLENTILAKLVAVSVSYCWQDFYEDDWTFVISMLQRWMRETVLVMEEMTENVDSIINEVKVSCKFDSAFEELEQALHSWISFPVIIPRIALFVTSFISDLTELTDSNLEESLAFLRAAEWDKHKERISEDVLRLLFAAGIVEALSPSCSEKAVSLLSSTLHSQSVFWDMVAASSVKCCQNVRNAAIESVQLWGLSKGPVSSLYAILFCARPISSLQLAAYEFLSSEPLCHLAIQEKEADENFVGNDGSTDCEHAASEYKPFVMRDEISSMIGKQSANIIETDLLANDRVNYFIAWSLLLSYLQSLPLASSTRGKLVQYLQDSVSPVILDCIFHHVSLKQGSSLNPKKNVEHPVEVTKAANSAKQALVARSAYIAIKTLWPIGTTEMASLAGALYGMMISLLPAYVRSWFGSLRDRSTSSSVEYFTKTWCSPHLLSAELSQVKEAIVADENFSISVNKSMYEITATYKKEETGMDLVIHLPQSYPLRPADVSCTRNFGVSEAKQRKWLLSMTACVRNQNGAIAEAIRVWRSYFDKEFEGVEECPICYSIIHATNRSLPQLACKTCRHKFHSACLYKWFNTSHKSTCPLCQTPF